MKCEPIALPTLMIHRNCLQAHLMESLKKLRARIRMEDYTIRPGKFGKFDMKIKKMMERVSKLQCINLITRLSDIFIFI